MSDNLTIVEYNVLKKKLEESINSAFEEFSNKTGGKVDMVYVHITTHEMGVDNKTYKYRCELGIKL